MAADGAAAGHDALVSTDLVAPPKPRRLAGWVPPLIGGLVAVLTFAVSAAIAGNWLAQNVEMKVLLSNVQASEDAMSVTQDRVREILDHLGDTDGDGELSEQEQQQMIEQSYDQLTAAALEGQQAIAEAGEAVRRQQIPLWHVNIQQAREAYLRHNRAWQDYLGRAAENPTEFLREQTEVNESFEDAAPLFRRALPEPTLFGLREKVDAIFAMPEGQTQSA